MSPWHVVFSAGSFLGDAVAAGCTSVHPVVVSFALLDGYFSSDSLVRLFFLNPESKNSSESCVHLATVGQTIRR